MTFREWLGSWRDWFRGVLFGMAAYDAVMMFRKQRADMEHLFVLIVFGDLVGVPILPVLHATPLAVHHSRGQQLEAPDAARERSHRPRRSGLMPND